MSTYNNNPALTTNAKSLRKNMTKEEKHMWYDFLKNLGVTVNRQKVIGNYIVDFCISTSKLIIELDGSQHCEPDKIAYDNCRTAYIQQQGFAVLRLSNLDVMRNFRSVCEAIDAAVHNRMKE